MLGKAPPASGQPTAGAPGRIEGLLKRASEVGNAVCFRPKGEAEGGGEVKAIWGIFFFPCWLFSSEFILLGAEEI